MLDDDFRVDRVAKLKAASRHATDGAGLQRQRQLVGHAFFGGHRRHALGHADAQIQHIARLQVDGSAAGNDLALVQRQRSNLAGGHLQVTGEGRVEVRLL